MLQLLETGYALYVLAGVCLLGIFTRMATGNLYKRLIKESGNMATTKNKSLKELKQRAENTYRMNQGLRDGGAWLDHQLCEMRFGGMTLAGWNNLSLQLTWLCLLLGGAGAFFSYWYQLDTVYVVMYGGGAVLMAMLTMLFDNGTAGGRRDLLVSSLEDYLENVLCPRLARNTAEDGAWNDSTDSSRSKIRKFSLARQNERAVQAERTGETADGEEPDQADRMVQAVGRGGESAVQADRTGQRDRTGQADRTGGRASSVGSGRRNNRNGRREAAATATEEVKEEAKGGLRDVDYLKKSLEQIAASKEKGKNGDESWLKDLGPDEMQLLGDILKEYLA